MISHLTSDVIYGIRNIIMSNARAARGEVGGCLFFAYVYFLLKKWCIFSGFQVRGAVRYHAYE